MSIGKMYQAADLTRQLDFLQGAALEVPVGVIGAGGIGAVTVMFLAKMGLCNIWVWDPDTLESHNWPNTMLPMFSGRMEWMDGSLKVDALQEIVYQMTGVTINAISDLFPELSYVWPTPVTSGDDEPLPHVMISGVDSMASRKVIWEFLKERDDWGLYIDGRMGGEWGQIYCVLHGKEEYIEAYEKHLVGDDQAVHEPCTGRAIIYNTAFIGSVICSLVKAFLTGEEIPWRVMFSTRDLLLIRQDFRTP